MVSSMDSYVKLFSGQDTRMTTSGTHKGEFRGIPPTGKTAAITEMLIYRISKGKIAEGWSVSDMLGLMQQIGSMPKR